MHDLNGNTEVFLSQDLFLLIPVLCCLSVLIDEQRKKQEGIVNLVVIYLWMDQTVLKSNNYLEGNMYFVNYDTELLKTYVIRNTTVFNHSVQILKCVK